MKKKTVFSPPYGDGTDCKDTMELRKRLSPPYGDGTDWEELVYGTD